MRVGITGGQGFIGSWIGSELRARGHEVVVFDRHNHVHTSDFWDSRYEFFLGDVRDSTAVIEFAAHVDGIIHLAAVLGTQETISNPRPSAETNILGSLNVFEAANQYDLPVVYAGVGNHWMRDHGTGSYTISKTAAEDFTRMFNKYRDGRISVVRPVNAYGPGQSIAAPYGPSKVRKIMPSFICRALTGADIEVYGDGTQISDCVYVRDVARVFSGTLESTAAFGPAPEPIGCGPATSVTVNEIAERVRDETVRVTGRDPVDIVHLPMRPGEVPNAVVSADVNTLHQLSEEFHENTFMSLSEGISGTIKYYANHWLEAYLDS
ncbi:MAG: NAD-dependent epimerase/dehydratase family protein [Actinobacteria bacterium]|nr:NAD-dependent epimerase/dehydratase family protein [Actinomycetota bacterium]